MARAGEFEIRISEGGHPIWAELFVGGERVGSVNSLQLADLAHAVDQARVEARHVARSMDPQRVADY